MVIPHIRAYSQALLTRPPLVSRRASSPLLPLDLHVLGLPPAFNLSHDQTLQLKFWLNEFWLINWLWWISLFISVTQLIDNSFLMTIIHECPHRLSSYIFKELKRNLSLLWEWIIDSYNFISILFFQKKTNCSQSGQVGFIFIKKGFLW